MNRVLPTIRTALAVAWASPYTLVGLAIGLIGLASGVRAQWRGPAYLLCSLRLWLQGRHPYRDNPFERAAYAQDELRRRAGRDERGSQ